MGVSTDALLVWGFDLGEEPEMPEGSLAGRYLEDEDCPVSWEDTYAIAVGVKPPPDEFNDDTKEAFREFWPARTKAVEEGGCSIEHHCHHEVTMYAVSACCYQAGRGDPLRLTASDLEVGAGWEGKLRAFCEVMGIPWQEPGWLLMSYWG